MTLQEFMDKVDWENFKLVEGGRIRKIVKYVPGGRDELCPLQVVVGREDYAELGRCYSLPVDDIMEAADSGARNTWNLRRQMLRRMGVMKGR
jgi:hypothetical protein